MAITIAQLLEKLGVRQDTVVAVLVKPAIATSPDPGAMGEAFGLAVKAGRMAYLSNMGTQAKVATASSPLTGFLHTGDA